MYQRKYSKFVEEELDRLLIGNDKEKQRYRNAMTAIEKVMSNPISKEFSKTLPDNFKAVDVLQQYRIFFIIINNPNGDNIDVVYFAWMNDEESIHQNGEKTDSYAVFRDLFAKGNIQEFQQQLEVDEAYKRHDPWEAAAVYVSYNRTNKTENTQAGAFSTLVLSRVTAKDFRIDSITVTSEDHGLASSLLECLCEEVDTDRVSLYYELQQNSTHYGKSRHILEKFNFRWEHDDDGMELWIRVAQS